MPWGFTVEDSSVEFLTERYDNGKWNFYLDSDGNKGLPENDVGIEQL